MHALIERLGSGSTLILDGGLGSMLIARGLPGGSPPESWVLEQPGEILAVHRAYFAAGSEAIHATTFGANPIRLARFGLDRRLEEINSGAVRLAREAGSGFLIADVGPTGEYLAPVGKADPEAWRDCFERQGRALAGSGPDALHIETMTDLREALIALKALRHAAPSLPVFVSMTFERKKRGFFTIMGNPLTTTLKSLVDAGADAVGANCTLASPEMRLLAEEARSAVPVPLVIQPNAGQPVVSSGALNYAQQPDDYAADAAAIASLGVEAVGGCCGTDPRFIAALCKRLARATTDAP